nr:MAG TPA: hypothetical protein [Caudoviricetes sp.]
MKRRMRRFLLRSERTQVIETGSHVLKVPWLYD